MVADLQLTIDLTAIFGQVVACTSISGSSHRGDADAIEMEGACVGIGVSE